MRFIVWMLMLLGLAGNAFAQSVPSIEDFSVMPNMVQVSLSPSGNRLAFISGETWEDRNIVVTSLDGSRGPVVVDVGDDQVVSRLSMVSDRHLWLTYIDRGNYWGLGDEGYWARSYILDVDDLSTIELGIDIEFASIDEEDPDSVLAWINEARRGGHTFTRVRGGRGMALYRVKLDGRRRNVVELGVRDFEYLLNGDDEAVVRQRGGHDGNDPYELWTTAGTGEWHRVHIERHRLAREFHFAARHTQDWVGTIEWVNGVDAGGRYAYFLSEMDPVTGELRPGRRRAAYRFDLLEERIEGPIAESDQANIRGFLYDWRTNAVNGVYWHEERMHVEYFDPQFAELQSQIEGFFPESNVYIRDWDRDFRRVVVYLVGGHTSGAYYLIDPQTGSVQLLANARPRLPEDSVSPVEVVRYQADDGLDLFGYLTVPRGRAAANLPLVLMPHGGPESRDYYGYDDWAQLIASRGYAVFQPQFRGSGGFGVEFAEAGYEGWGTRMQQDLDDGVDALAARGIIDPARVCIFGWSYGGYAALAGATLTPDRYRCAIAGAGVSDIRAMMRFEGSQYGGYSWRYWSRNIGDWRGSNADTIDQVSPARQAANVQAPLMIVHGTEDIVVDYEQAEIMAAAMDEAGRPYELVTIDGGKHYSMLMTVDHKRQLYSNLERFLFEHNPPD